MRIIILGAPGTGKRAQTQRLAEKYGIKSLTTGELVKCAMSEPDGYGPQVRMLHAAGQHVSDDLLLNLLQERLRQPEMAEGFVLNGFPRNLLQALTLDESLAELDQPLDLVILLHIETDALMEHLVGRRTCRSCGAQFNIYTHPAVVEGICDHCGGRLHQRADDNEETVSSRLHVFEHLTHALLDHYGKQEKLLQVDGEGSAEQVFERLCQGMDRFLKERPLETKQANTGSVAAVAEAEPSYEVESSNPESADTAQTAAEAKVKSAKSSRVAKKKASPKKAASSAPSKSKKAAAKKKAVVKSDNKSKPKAQKKTAVKKPGAKSATTKKKQVKTEISAKKKVAQKKKVAKKKIAKKLLSKKKKPISTAKKKVAKKKAAVSKKKVAAKKKVLAKKKVVAKKRIATKKASVAKKSATKKGPSRPAKKVAKKKAVQAKRPAKSAVKKTQKKRPVKKAAAAKSVKKRNRKNVSRKKSARR